MKEKAKEKAKGKGLDMHIQSRLTRGFLKVAAIGCAALVVSVIALFIITSQYANTLKKYGFSQGDIGKMMVVFSENRSSLRAAVGYVDQDSIAKVQDTYQQKKDKFAEYYKEVGKCITGSDAKALYKQIQEKMDDYWKVSDEVMAQGATMDNETSMQAQEREINELSNVYDEAYNMMAKLMNLDVQKGNVVEKQLQIFSLILIVAFIVCIVLVLYLSVIIGKNIAKSFSEPIKQLGERLKSFTQGDLDSPFPEYDVDDEIAEMIQETKKWQHL